MDRIIVSGADARYFPLLEELHASLRDRGVLENAAFGVLDCGLADAQRRALEAQGAVVVAAVWGFDFPLRDRLERERPGLKAMTSRPLLPRLFPGFAHILWLDADTWLQDAAVVDLFFATAAPGRLAAVLELDRAYAVLQDGRRYWNQLEEWWLEATGAADVTAAMYRRPTINTGAFALPAGVGHWAPWLRATRAWFAQSRTMGPSTALIEQLALNFVVYRGKFPFTPLPTRCNWLCHLALPAWDPGRARFCDPLPPHEPLGLVHVCDWTKNAPQEVAGTDGRARRMHLGYPPRPASDPAG